MLAYCALLLITGFQHVSNVEEFPVEKWNAIIAVLLSAPFHLIRLLLPEMRRRGWGRIINLASVHSVRASPFKAAYVSAKHGLAGLTKVTFSTLSMENYSVCNENFCIHVTGFTKILTVLMWNKNHVYLSKFKTNCLALHQTEGLGHNRFSEIGYAQIF